MMLNTAILGDFYLNAISLSSWFEISGVNENDPENRCCFCRNDMSDQFDGRLRYFPFTGNVSYIPIPLTQSKLMIFIHWLPLPATNIQAIF
jgi:hypothetical protein